MKLLDLPLLGIKFTWFQHKGGAASGNESIRISNWLWGHWGVVFQRALPRNVYDHCPFILKYVNQSWGPKPFRFNNHGLSHCSHHELVVSFKSETNIHV